MSSAPERIALAALEPQPWKNGAGLTREIAVAPRTAGHADFDWRISLAEVASDAPFSAFPGIDRCITLLSGAGMRLASTDGGVDHRLDQLLAPFYFSGDVPLHATLIDGACADFNVMARRGVWRAEVSVIRASCELGGADALLLLAIAGTWQLDAGATDHDAAWNLEPDTALLWRSGRGVLWATPGAVPNPALLQVQLCQDRP